MYSLRAACGKFGEQEIVEPDGWVKVSGVKKRNEKLFVVRAEGNSMEPLIGNGIHCVFEYREGTCDNNDIVLCEYSENLGEELTGAYTIKKFVGTRRGGGWSAARLVPENDDFDEIKLINKCHNVRAYRIVGVYRGEIEVIDD